MLAVARRPPRKEYLLLLAHPPMTTPYTASESVARMKMTPMLRSAIWKGHLYVIVVEARNEPGWRAGSVWETSVEPTGISSAAAWAGVKRSTSNWMVLVACLYPPHGMTAMLTMTVAIMIAGATVKRILSTPRGR